MSKDRRDYSDLLDKIDKVRIELLTSQLNLHNQIMERIKTSHESNETIWRDHRNQDHGEIKAWQSGHFGQAIDAVHTIIDKRLASHSKRFWITWLSGAATAIAALWALFTEWAKRNH